MDYTNDFVNTSSDISHHVIISDGIFPNNNLLPVLVYKKALSVSAAETSEAIKRVFDANGWRNAWVEGIYTYNHYHSNTHEVLGISKGRCMLLLGGADGEIQNLKAGDVVIIPAGVAHKNTGCTEDFECVGAYPDGRNYDINLGKPEERQAADDNIKKVPLPESDPVFGPDGPLIHIWKNRDLTVDASHITAQF